jgi:hypothetical protein
MSADLQFHFQVSGHQRSRSATQISGQLQYAGYVMTEPTDDEIAAALVAVRLYLEAEQPDAPQPDSPPSAWREAARLEAQGVSQRRGPAPHWGNVERLRRASL